MSKPKVYISGPMTGYVNFNRDAFYAAEARLQEFGYDTINPPALDKADGSDVEIKPHAWYMRRDIAALLDADFIYLLPGWRWSKGASLEATVAKGCGIGVLTDLEPHIWRTFEGEPEDQGEALRYEVSDLDRDALAAVDLPVKHVSDATPSATGDEDLADHPRFGPAFEEAQPCTSGAVLFKPPAAEEAHADGSPCYGQCAKPKRHDVRHGVEDYDLAEITRPQPGDEFPNVGYVRRFKARLGLDRSVNEGGRRSA